MLALQGGFAPHARAIERLGHTAIEVRGGDELRGLSGLVLPGGESTAQLTLIDRFGLDQPLRAFVAAGHPVLATCAGLIVAAARVGGPPQRSLGFLDVEVTRNAWGRQVDSFEARDDADAFALLFIRAPRITAVGPEVQVLATFRGEPVLVRQGRVTGAAFHPELLGQLTLHRQVFGEAQSGR